MKTREKALLLVVGSLVGVFVAYLGVRAIIVRPLREIDRKIAAVRERIEKINGERRAFFTAENLVKQLAQRTFSEEVGQASAKSGETLTQQILQSGLSESDFSRLPVGPRKLRGAQELGWSVQGEGRLDQVVNLLFLLQEAPHLHRLESIVLSAGEQPGRVKVRFRYLSLVPEPAPAVEPIPLEPQFSLNAPERRVYDGIVQRDLLRPYIKRPPPPPPAGSPSQPGRPSRGAPTPPGPESLRIVSLSEWQGVPEIHVRDLAAERTLRFKAGDALGGGTIVMVDYRPLPMPGKVGLLSHSRVILKIGSDYFAVERGQSLAEKYRLTPEQLPEGLARL